MNARRRFASFAAVVAIAAAGDARSADDPKISRCSVSAFVNEIDPGGLNVRDSPSVSGRLVGRLAPVMVSRELDSMRVRVEVDLLGSRLGWFQIANARDNTTLTGRPARPMFKGRGWVSGRKLTAKSQAQQGRLEPSATSAVAVRFDDGGALDSDAIVDASLLLDCQGSWVQLELSSADMPADVARQLVVSPEARHDMPTGRFKAWFNAVCGVQETTCDGLGDGATK